MSVFSSCQGFESYSKISSQSIAVILPHNMENGKMTQENRYEREACSRLFQIFTNVFLK